MSAIDELRRMLTDAGVEYRWDSGTVTWYIDGVMYNAWGFDNERLTMSVCYLTPAQAIAATVRRGICHMETADGCQNWNSCSECGADYYTDQPINYCPNCGRRVVAE